MAKNMTQQFFRQIAAYSFKAAWDQARVTARTMLAATGL
jgi:hypothetical protein